MSKFTRNVIALAAATSLAIAGFGSTALARHGADDPAGHKASHKHHRHHHHARHHGRDDGPGHR